MVRKFERVAVLMGGRSPEREVSLRSGHNVLAALKNSGYEVIAVDPACDPIPTEIDAAYIALHGEGGEDGVIQGVLTQYGIPYTGPKVLASAVSMNKVFTKKILISSGLPTPAFEVLNGPATTLPFPFMLKPVDAGSSIGISKIRNQQEFESHYAAVRQQFSQVFAEQFIAGSEITVGVIENRGSIQVLPILQLVPKKEFYDYEAKYTKGLTEFILPARISEQAAEKARKLAIDTFAALNCRSVSRIDMIVDEYDNVFVIENNTSPGMTDVSDLPAQAREAGISFDELVMLIMESASL